MMKRITDVGKMRIICVGNRSVPEDAAGPRVYDWLVRRGFPPEVEVVDGGLAGLDLIRIVEGAARVVFVDSVAGFSRPGKAIVLDATEAARHAANRYDHTAGLAYLLRVLPDVCEGEMPDVLLLGIEGRPDDRAIAAAAETCLTIAVNGHSRPTQSEPELSGE
jgi:hydrogenase maturation protease